MLNAVFEKTKLHLKTYPLSRDLAYSSASFFVLAMSGIVINLTISILRNPTDLGIFNLSYAVYIIASQFAAFGIHYSVLRYSALYQKDLIERSQLFYSAIVITLISGLIGASILYQVAPQLGHLFDSDQVSAAIRLSSFGLIFFPLNKVLLAYLNGLQQIKTFSLLQGLRYVIVMAVVAAICFAHLPIAYASLCFLVAEASTVLLAFVYLMSNQSVIGFEINQQWMRKHLVFGSKSILAGIFVELNSRVDVILIGFYLSKYDVGIYSFAAMLVEGIYQILAMIRTNFNPFLTGYVRDNNWVQAILLRKKSKTFILPAIVILALLVLIFYVVFSTYIVTDKGLQHGIVSLAILLTGLIGICTLVPFDNLMLIAGYPMHQTVQQVTIIVTNLLLTAILLPHVGIIGAALGTVVGNIAGILFLNRYVNQLIGWRLIRNQKDM